METHQTSRFRRTLLDIFTAGLARVDPYQMIRDHVRVQDDVLLVESDDRSIQIDLQAYRRILLLGAGKASAPMARAFEDLLGSRIAGGLVCVKYGHVAPLTRVELVEAGHPIPDENGLKAAERIRQLAAAADGGTLVLFCLSGGGSALLPSPLDDKLCGGLVRLTLADKQQTTRALLGCGAGIREINCVRSIACASTFHSSKAVAWRACSILPAASISSFPMSSATISAASLRG